MQTPRLEPPPLDYGYGSKRMITPRPRPTYYDEINDLNKKLTRCKGWRVFWFLTSINFITLSIYLYFVLQEASIC